jgi:hypothetical protein
MNSSNGPSPPTRPVLPSYLTDATERYIGLLCTSNEKPFWIDLVCNHRVPLPKRAQRTGGSGKHSWIEALMFRIYDNPKVKNQLAIEIQWDDGTNETILENGNRPHFFGIIDAFYPIEDKYNHKMEEKRILCRGTLSTRRPSLLPMAYVLAFNIGLTIANKFRLTHTAAFFTKAIKIEDKKLKTAEEELHQKKIHETIKGLGYGSGEGGLDQMHPDEIEELFTILSIERDVDDDTIKQTASKIVHDITAVENKIDAVQNFNQKLAIIRDDTMALIKHASLETLGRKKVEIVYDLGFEIAMNISYLLAKISLDGVYGNEFFCEATYLVRVVIQQIYRVHHDGTDKLEE